MKKSTKAWLKQQIAWFLLVLMSINSFAAVVSDSDGAAFVTKEEFENLKKEFDTQISRYNESLDRKIDGAIANFLYGQRIDKRERLDPIVSNYKDIRWMHGPYMYFTKRHFNEYTTTAGRYTDTTGWQIINPENRRQTINDGYCWFYDHWAGEFNSATFGCKFHPYDVGEGWGSGRKGVTTARGPSIFAVGKKNGVYWTVSSKDGGFVGELGHDDHYYGRVHLPINPWDDGRGADALGGINNNTRLKYNATNSNLYVENVPLDEGDLLAFKIVGINVEPNSYDPIQMITHIKQSWNPSIITSQFGSLWASGTDALPLKVACGYDGFMGDNYNRIDSGLVEDNRWATETQYKKDMDNFIFSMWGADVTGMMNFAPPIEEAGVGKYINLAESPNVVTVPMIVKQITLSGNSAMPPNKGTVFDQNLGTTQSVGQVDDAPERGQTTFSIPLFYKASWSNICAGDFKNKDGNALCKSDGMPIIIDSTSNGELKLQIKYEEKADTDTTIVTLTPDHKIKTYFKNEKFTDDKSEFLYGYTNYDGTGTITELNGTEWNKNATTDEKIISVNIPLQKGDSVWMRIDPLTSNGIYCAMTDYKCEFIPE